MVKRCFLFALWMGALSIVNVCAQSSWEVLYYEDFGGNSADDPQYGSENKNVNPSLDFAGDLSIGYDYTITKHYDNNSNWYVGGDHTSPKERDKGYFLLVNPGNEQGAVVIYSKEIDGLKMGQTYRFSIWAANMAKPELLGIKPCLSLMVSDSQEGSMPIVRNAYAQAVLNVSEKESNDECLDWQEISVEFRLDQDVTSAYILVNVEFPEADGNDFAVDDIRFEVLGDNTGVENWMIDERRLDNRCYDWQGRVIEPKQGDLFIQNGKKYIYK